MKTPEEPPCVATFDLISSPEYGILDSALTASSEYTNLWSATHSRLNSDRFWQPAAGTGPGEWIMADLGTNRMVFAHVVVKQISSLSSCSQLVLMAVIGRMWLMNLGRRLSLKGILMQAQW